MLDTAEFTTGDVQLPHITHAMIIHIGGTTHISHNFANYFGCGYTWFYRIPPEHH